MKTIFDKTKLKDLKLRNRIFRSATWLAMADESGEVNDEIIGVYKRLAEGGAGAIVTGLVSVAPYDAYLPGGVKFYDDKFIDWHKRLTSAVHSAGAKIFMQTAITDSVRLSGGEVCEASIDSLSKDEILERVKYFGNAAARAKKAGYDGVQIHAAHFFFLSKFISPLLNHRTDEYGGSAEGRAKILVDILRDMRSKTGKNFLIITKLNASDMYPGGISKDDFLTAGKMLSENGIDAIEVSANGTSRDGIRAGKNEAYFKDYASALCEVVSVPAILVGGHRSIESMNSVLNSTKIEYLSMSRPLVRESDLINRWQNSDTRPSLCVSCNSCYSTPGHECIFNIMARRKSK